MDFRYKRNIVAEDGGNGAGKQCTGKNGGSLIIRVPRGTVVRTAETREIIQDMSGTNPSSLPGGATGAGATSTLPPPPGRTPQFAKRRSAGKSGRCCWS